MESPDYLLEKQIKEIKYINFIYKQSCAMIQAGNRCIKSCFRQAFFCLLLLVGESGGDHRRMKNECKTGVCGKEAAVCR